MSNLNPNDVIDVCTAASAEIDRLREELETCKGYLVTAAVMLSGGEDPKAMAKRIYAFVYPTGPDNF
jgi:hypothetical protein